MYGYEEFIDLTPEQLLQKITQEQIFEFVLQEPFNFSSRYKSPCREDNNPGCRFEQREDGTIIFVDWGEKFFDIKKIHRSCFGLVIDKFDVTLTGAIRLLCIEFNLSTNAKDYEPIDPSKVVYQRSESTSNPADIKYTKKPYTKSEIIHWSQFIIRPEHLLEDNVFAASKFTISKVGKIFTIRPFSHCYVIDFIDAVKVYQPYNSKYKWLTNCNENHIGNIDNLPLSGEELIIQKSYKDHRVLRNLYSGFKVIWLQNEGCVPSLEILTNLTERFKLITIFFDNDKDGMIAARKLMDIFNSIRPGCSRMVYLPEGIGTKDPGELVKKEGRHDSMKILTQIGLTLQDGTDTSSHT